MYSTIVSRVRVRFNPFWVGHTQCHVRMAIFVDSCGCTSFCDECHLAWREFREVNADPDERWLALSAPNFVRRMTEEELALRHIGNATYPRCSRCSAWLTLEPL